MANPTGCLQLWYVTSAVQFYSFSPSDHQNEGGMVKFWFYLYQSKHTTLQTVYLKIFCHSPSAIAYKTLAPLKMLQMCQRVQTTAGKDLPQYHQRDQPPSQLSHTTNEHVQAKVQGKNVITTLVGYHPTCQRHYRSGRCREKLQQTDAHLQWRKDHARGVQKKQVQKILQLSLIHI